MLRAGAPLGIYNGLKSVGEGSLADEVALNIVEGILAGAQIEGGMQILESLATTYLPKAGAALYEKWLAGGRKASVFSREAREAMVNGLAKELRLAGKEYETVWGGVKDTTPVNSKSLPYKAAALETPKTIPTMTVDGKPMPDIQQSVPKNGNTSNLGDDIVPSAKEGKPGAKVENSDIELILDTTTDNLSIKGGKPSQANESIKANKTNTINDVIQTKPKHSRDPKVWINRGGRITIESDGTWVYHDWENHSVRYPGGYPDFDEAGMVKDSVTVKRFVSYSVDFAYADEIAATGPISKFETWHHYQDMHTLQKMDSNIHSRYTHKGGMSMKRRSE